MSYKCLECANIFDEADVSSWEERHGNEALHIEILKGCPICGGAYEKTVKCSCCNGEFLKEELKGCLCSSCLEEVKEEYRYSPQKCYELSSGENESIEINYFLSCMFTKKQIEEILYKQLLSASLLVSIDCSKFIETDKGWFEEKIIEEVKK